MLESEDKEKGLVRWQHCLSPSKNTARISPLYMADGDDDLLSQGGETLSPSPDLLFTMDEDSHRDKEVDDDDINEVLPVDRSERRVCHGGRLNTENAVVEARTEFVPPVAGMEFETYDDAYNYYNCYAKDVGFRVRVKNSWFKRSSKEKYGAVLCCSSQGFKRIKDAHRLRKESRTGCPAMIRMRLAESRRWRVLEVILEHNHLLGVKPHRLAKKLEVGKKRRLQPNTSIEVQKLKIYRPLVIDAGGNVSQTSTAREFKSLSEYTNRLGFKKGDALAIYNYLCRMQLTNPNFFYLMDFGDEGVLKNVLWIDSRSRAACCYFNDVIFLDNTYLASKYEIPLVALVGINHHGQAILLGCGLLSGETSESYTWFFKVWLKCLSGHCPQTIITDRCTALESAISEVFPGSHHRFGVSHIMRKVPEKLGGLRNYDSLTKALYAAVYGSMRVIEFEAAWGHMVQYFGVTNHKWLCSLFEERARWAPVYSRDIFFAGISTSKPEEILKPFFDKYVHKQMTLKEFLDKYELALHKRHKEETLADIESRTSIPILKTRCPFEKQLSKIYTRGIFHKFQLEVEEMYSCFSTTQLQLNVFLVKERILSEGNQREIRDFEVLFNRAASEVCCICNCFNFNGFLCRHALSVLNFNGVEEIPQRYLLSRWKKDYKRLRAIDLGHNVNVDQEILRFGQLYESALQVVEEGLMSHEHFEIALQAMEESLERVRDAVEERPNVSFT